MLVMQRYAFKMFLNRRHADESQRPVMTPFGPSERA
jgi:hypothetical protein